MVRSTLGPQWIIGWREWLAFPELGIPHIKAKIDTGARTSALHAYDVELFRRDRKDMVRFCVAPLQRETSVVIRAEARLVEQRRVRNSGGTVELRPVIVTPIKLRGRTWKIELTLTGRDEMGFRLLLGRQALRSRLLVDPGRSFIAGRPQRSEP